jgi:hypothetical protein
LPSTIPSKRRLRELATAIATSRATRVAPAIRPPGSEPSWPLMEPLTASDSSITTTRSNGVNWPTVRLPLTRTITSKAT